MSPHYSVAIYRIDERLFRTAAVRWLISAHEQDKSLRNCSISREEPRPWPPMPLNR